MWHCTLCVGPAGTPSTPTAVAATAGSLHVRRRAGNGLDALQPRLRKHMDRPATGSQGAPLHAPVTPAQSRPLRSGIDISCSGPCIWQMGLSRPRQEPRASGSRPRPQLPRSRLQRPWPSTGGWPNHVINHKPVTHAGGWRNRPHPPSNGAIVHPCRLHNDRDADRQPLPLPSFRSDFLLQTSSGLTRLLRTRFTLAAAAPGMARADPYSL